MEPEYVIYESKMNWMSVQQMAKLKPNPYLTIMEKLVAISKTKNKAHDSIFNGLANKLHLLETKMPLNGKKRAKKIQYCKKKGVYIAGQKIQGVYYHILTSRNLEEVREAQRKFCEEHGLQI